MRNKTRARECRPVRAIYVDVGADIVMSAMMRAAVLMASVMRSAQYMRVMSHAVTLLLIFAAAMYQITLTLIFDAIFAFRYAAVIFATLACRCHTPLPPLRYYHDAATLFRRRRFFSAAIRCCKFRHAEFPLFITCH